MLTDLQPWNYIAHVENTLMDYIQFFLFRMVSNSSTWWTASYRRTRHRKGWKNEIHEPRDSRWNSCLKWLQAAGLTCPTALPSIFSATRPISFHCRGSTIWWRGGWSRLSSRCPATACYLLLAHFSKNARQGEGSVKGQGGGTIECQKEWEKREGWRKGECCASTTLLATTDKVSQPWRQRQINSWPPYDVRVSIASHDAEAGWCFQASTKSKAPIKWGSSLATLL